MKLTKYIDYFESPIGLLRICSNENILTECTLVDKHFSEDCCVTGGAALSAKIQLQEYFLRKRKTFDVEIDFSSGTDFQKQIWSCLQKIPYGQTVTYGKLAELAGCDNGARACGNAVSKNKFLIFVPCHRVLSQTGIGGFSAGGVKKKFFLLDLENPEWERRSYCVDKKML